MRCTKAIALAVALVAGTVQADPRPPFVDKTVHFPMQSKDFRPILDRCISYYQRGAAEAARQGKTVPSGWEDKMRFDASVAMEDGVVTQAEFERVLRPPR
jgi:hypothetical protein